MIEEKFPETQEMDNMVRRIYGILNSAFVRPPNYRDILISKNVEKKIPDYSVAVVRESDDTLTISLGVDQMDEMFTDLDIPDENYRDVLAYTSLSLLAGFLLSRSITNFSRPGRRSEVSEAFMGYVSKSNNITTEVSYCALESNGLLDTVNNVLVDIEKTNVDEIAAINLHRIGSGIVLIAAEIENNTRIFEAHKAMKLGFRDNMDNLTTLDYETATDILRISKVVASMDVNERIVKRRGLGFIFPIGKIELIELRNKLKEIQNKEELDIIDRALGVMESGLTFSGVIKLSGGHSVVEVDDSMNIRSDRLEDSKDKYIPGNNDPKNTNDEIIEKLIDSITTSVTNELRKYFPNDNPSNN